MMNISKIFYSMFLVTLFATLLNGCVYSLSDEVSHTDEPNNDNDYSTALEEASRDADVIMDFETRYKVHATHLSPAFRAAFTKRMQTVYLEGSASLGDDSSKAGFFVTAFCPEDDRIDLTNPHHWTILLKTKDGTLKPVIVKRLKDKERWRAFFPRINKWTREFLVVFDSPSTNPNSPDLVEKTPIELTFANADAHVSLTW